MIYSYENREITLYADGVLSSGVASTLGSLGEAAKSERVGELVARRHLANTFGVYFPLFVLDPGLKQPLG